MSKRAVFDIKPRHGPSCLSQINDDDDDDLVTKFSSKMSSYTELNHVWGHWGPELRLGAWPPSPAPVLRTASDTTSSHLISSHLVI